MDAAPTYFECPQCGFLSADPSFGTGETPCPYCGAAGDSRRVFPTERLRRLDSRIRRYHSEDESEIVVILVAAFLEAILEDIIDRILTARGADLSVREVVLDGQRAIGGRIGRLFPHLTGEQFEEAAAELGYERFPARWREVRTARNAFIHDSPFNGPQETIDAEMAKQSMDLLDQAYQLFVLINNRFVASTESPRCEPADGL
ncbi:MAG: hypothetical protein RQ731_03975 [Anaerosomatales bacterium]|nr:hypothetical protein [Anaerosomatales bacterium]MDT8433902.1 hypothetical protein [Anaerosomatales bacterium]